MAGRKRTTAATSRRTTRATAPHNAPPEIYRQMLADAEVSSGVSIDAAAVEPPRKRRRPGEKAAASRPATTKTTSTHPQVAEVQGRVNEVEEDEEDLEFEDVKIPAPTVQTVYRESDEEDEEEDDNDGEEEQLQFEDVDFSFPNLNLQEPVEYPKELQLDLSTRASTNESAKRAANRRKPINKSEKDRRVDIHRIHLLCLLSHAARRNRWCNDREVQRTLRRSMLTKELKKYLNPGTDLTQFGQTNSLKNGLQTLETIFRTKYDITERGLRRALWADKEEHLKEYRVQDDAESPMERLDFREAAKCLQGSRDVGAQLYCALLRSAGVQARLVCSLQPLTFASGGPSMTKPAKRQKPSLEEQYARRPKYDTSFDSPALTSSSPIRRRTGHPNATAFNVPSVAPIVPLHTPESSKKIRECAFPVYWVEILDVGHQKWQPVDPLVTKSFWKPNVLEPPASERENCMTYVVGFEADGTARDVTKRYAKAYNAKTRKLRIESVATNGERWWRKTLKAYSRGFETDMDQIEDHELAAAEAREPMPRNVADFKDHPIYALERHMRRNEVLIPGATTAGTIGAGSKAPLERIYRRKDVRIARTKDKWYRLGREILGNETPVKYLPKPLKKRSGLFGSDDEGSDANEEDDAGTPIFTMDQTITFKPPPVINGRIPKNRFGNLDIYVPSMVPEGGAYIADELGAQAAFTLGIDYAPALTGFQFKGRKGTAVLHGVVVASENEEAVRAVIEGLKDQEAEMERLRRIREVLRMWKKLLMNLRVRQRIWANVDEEQEQEAGEQESDEITGQPEDSSDIDGDTHIDNSDEDDKRNSLDEELPRGFIVDDDADYGPGGF